MVNYIFRYYGPYSKFPSLSYYGADHLTLEERLSAFEKKKIPANIFVQKGFQHLTTGGKKFGHLERAGMHNVTERENIMHAHALRKKLLVHEMA